MSISAMAPQTLFYDERWPRWIISGVSAIVFLCGLLWQNPVLLGGGAVGLCVACVAAMKPSPFVTKGLKNMLPGSEGTAPGKAQKEVLIRPVTAQVASPKKEDAEPSSAGLVETMFATERYALLLRPETCRNLTPLQWHRAVQMLDERMSLVPEGHVLIGFAAEQATISHGAYEAPAPKYGRGLAKVEACYIDRYAVTNAEYQHFVDAGGYEQLDFWPEEALPAMFDFIDQTGLPGPRYWRDGHYPASAQANLPVVGISWYEAAAYARWVGKVLPTDAQWTKAGAWPIESAPGRLTQRRYPWGDSFDSRRACIWGCGIKEPLPVDGYPDGLSVGGVYQLIGNVWEWSSSNLADSMPTNVTVPAALRSIRGGAFDTYFETQATCHFQSGEHPLARRPNIGFRLAIPMANLASLESIASIDPEVHGDTSEIEEEISAIYSGEAG